MDLEKILKTDERIWDEEILDYPQLFELARTYDKKLLETLFKNKDSKEKFFIQVGDSHVFKYNEFRFYLEENQVNNSFTQYANKIGLSSQGEHLSDSTDYVLDWPYKDCVLEGGMSSEEDTDTFIDKKVETTPGKIDKKTGTVISTEKTKVIFSQAKRKREEIFYNNIIADKEIDRLLDKKALKNFTRYTAKGEEKVQEIKRDEDGTIKENLLIKGNNLLALHSLKEQFAGKIDLVYFDPPYNPDSAANTFSYNNRFNHSTFYTFISNRTKAARELLSDKGFYAVSIDHNELGYCIALIDEIFGRENRVAVLAIESNPGGRSDSKFFATSHENMLIYAKDSTKADINGLPLSEEDLKKYSLKDELSPYKLMSFVRGGSNSTPSERPNLYYPIYVSHDLKKISIEKFDKSFEVFPLDSQLKKRVWRWGKETVENNKDDLVVKKSRDKIKIYTKDRLKNEKKPKTLWDDSKYSAVSHGSMRLKKNDIDFSFPKSIYLMKDIIHILTNDNSIILDITAGSGTTGCAVQTINNEENKNKKFILIEQMSYVNSSTIKALKLEVEKDSFIYFELAEYNEEAKNKIDACKSYKELKKLFTELTDYYFLNYNVSVKQFNDQLLDDKDFQELPLEEQKTLFKALLDNNQLYIPHKEQEDGKYNLSKEDQKLTNEFYG